MKCVCFSPVNLSSVNFRPRQRPKEDRGGFLPPLCLHKNILRHQTLGHSGPLVFPFQDSVRNLAMAGPGQQRRVSGRDLDHRVQLDIDLKEVPNPRKNISAS